MIILLCRITFFLNFLVILKQQQQKKVPLSCIKINQLAEIPKQFPYAFVEVKTFKSYSLRDTEAEEKSEMRKFISKWSHFLRNQ